MTDDIDRVFEWNRAARALIEGNSQEVYAALAPEVIDPQDGALVYSEMLAMAAVGAQLTAIHVLRVHTPPYPPAPGKKHVLTTLALDTGRELSATERVAIHAVLIAATGDLSGVRELVMGYAGPGVPDARGARRLADLTTELLRMYVVYAQMDTPVARKEPQ